MALNLINLGKNTKFTTVCLSVSFSSKDNKYSQNKRKRLLTYAIYEPSRLLHNELQLKRI